MNIIIYGFESGPMLDVFFRLQNEKKISIKKWYYDQTCSDQVLKTLSYTVPTTKLWRGNWKSWQPFPNEYISNYINEHMDWLMQEFARNTEFFHESYYEYINIINYVINRLYHDITENKVDLILFSDIPHGNLRCMLYLLAKSMNVSTLFLFTVSAFPKKMFYGHRIEDVGKIYLLPDYHKNSTEYHISESFEKKLDYMSAKQIKKDRGEDWERKIRFFIHPTQWIKERSYMIKQDFIKYESISDFVEQKITKEVITKIRKYQYNYHIKTLSKKNIDFDKKYVYFPLHLQPEMTTDAIGGIYRDQILAIEKIKNIIPDDWFIYVKENPKQLYSVRGKFFFKRLTSIPNVIYIDRSVDTYKLMEHCQFLATITGTAAWESISGGKAALIFGTAWYESLPGIFKYHENIDINEILDYKVNHRLLEKSMENLQKKACDGIWEEFRMEKVKDLDLEWNRKSLYNSFCFLLDNEIRYIQDSK